MKNIIGNCDPIKFWAFYFSWYYLSSTSRHNLAHLNTHLWLLKLVLFYLQIHFRFYNVQNKFCIILVMNIFSGRNYNAYNTMLVNSLVVFTIIAMFLHCFGLCFEYFVFHQVWIFFEFCPVPFSCDRIHLKSRQNVIKILFIFIKLTCRIVVNFAESVPFPFSLPHKERDTRTENILNEKKRILF